jgi:hypothetical protein
MLLVSALLAFAFQTPAQTAAAVTLADLVPKNTVAFVQAPSLERAAKFVQRLQSTFEPKPGPQLDGAKLLAMLSIPADPSAVDFTKPVGVCLVLEAGPGAQPLPTLLIPVSDGEKITKSLQQPGAPWKAVVKGGYACIGMGMAPELPSAPAKIARGLPEGEIAARLDLKTLIAQYREQIDEGLNAVEEQGGAMAASQSVAGINPAPMMGAYVDILRDFIDSAETLDLGLRLEGDGLELGMALVNAEGSAFSDLGSKEKTGARSLGSLLDPNASVSAVFGMDMVAMMKRFQPLLDVVPDMYPETLRPAMKQLFGHMGEFYGLMGTSMAGSFDFAPDGVRYSAFLDCKDPAKLLGLYHEMLKSMPGFGSEELPAREVDGAKVSGFHMKMDLAELAKQMGGKAPAEAELDQMDQMMKKLFGPDGMTLRVATKDGKTAVVIGGGDDYLHATLARMSAKHETPAFVARGLAQVGDLNPCFVIHYDLGRMMEGLKNTMGDIIPGGFGAMPSMALTISAWGGVDGRTWRGALGCNLAELAALQNAKEPKPPKTR